MEQVVDTRLTSYCAAAGCAAKLAPEDLEVVLQGLSGADGYAAGVETRDDAGWIEFGGGYLLQSVDFFTPMVDDPHRFGQIAAANALSDIYAMGGRPLTAMNLVAFPRDQLPLEILSRILAGGMEKIAEAGAAFSGGHSVRDSEPKYGVSVTGFVERERLVSNQGAQPGDHLVLTKPLGVGILATALKRRLLVEEDIEAPLEAMARLNAATCEAMQRVGVSAATDVTGFGLLGHLREMLAPGGLGATIESGAVPVWDRAGALAAEGCRPGGLQSNRDHVEAEVEADGVPADRLLPLFDPQTSGGLLIAVPEERAAALAQALEERGELAARIGEVTAGPGTRIEG
jgi:selenide,water dikinase